MDEEEGQAEPEKSDSLVGVKNGLVIKNPVDSNLA